jgi:pimeloyl-ACP methyl ester carboxylesterase
MTAGGGRAARFQHEARGFGVVSDMRLHVGRARSAKGRRDRVVWTAAVPGHPHVQALITGVPWIKGSDVSSELRVGFRAVDGLQIRFAESGGSASQRLVLTSPWPESLYAFERVWPRLSRTARLLAVDLPGFGRSQQRTSLMSPMAMSDFLISILDDWDIRDPHLICPGTGTAAALFTAANHPGRVRSLVIGGGGAAYPLAVGEALQDLIRAPGIGAFRPQDPRALVQGMMTELGPAAPASYPEQLRLLAGRLPGIFTPVQIITGRRDRLVPVANAEFLLARLPNSRLEVLDAGHFVWEEAAGPYAAIITAWVNGGYLTGNSGMDRT